MDYDARVRAWQKGGRLGRRPLPRILPNAVDLCTSSWWATAVMLFGMMVCGILAGLGEGTLPVGLVHFGSRRARSRMHLGG